MSEIVRVVELNTVKSFYLTLKESAKHEKELIEKYNFLPKSLENIEKENYILWERKE